MSRVLVLGGSRSGKSAFAESLLADVDEVEYLATAAHRGDDPEWADRIAAHQSRRPSHWRTVETLEVGDALRGGGPSLLVDSITLWVAGVMEGDLDRQVDALCTAWETTSRRVIAVSDEVGSGVVPETASGRRFRDALGTVNQRLAAIADEVHLVVAGIPLRLR